MYFAYEIKVYNYMGNFLHRFLSDSRIFEIRELETTCYHEDLLSVHSHYLLVFKVSHFSTKAKCLAFIQELLIVKYYLDHERRTLPTSDSEFENYYYEYKDLQESNAELPDEFIHMDLFLQREVMGPSRKYFSKHKLPTFKSLFHCLKKCSCERLYKCLMFALFCNV